MNTNKKIVEIQEWFQKKSIRDQFALFLTGFVLLYVILHFTLLRPVITQKNDFIKKTQDLKAQKIAVAQELSALEIAIKNPFFVQLIEQQKRLALKVKNAGLQLEKIKPKFMAQGDLARLTKDILAESHEVAITSIEELPSDLWAKGDTNKVLSEYIAQGIYELIIQVNFKTDFFGAIAYLKRLEKLPWKVYWDSLDYKVSNYPDAIVQVKMHLLSLEKS